METGRVLDIQRHSIHDGPGVRTTVFLKGCPLKCIWCCNPESQSFDQDYMYVPSKCIGCGACTSICPVMACKNGIIDHEKCIKCGKCAEECYAGAIKEVGKRMTVEQVMNEVNKDLFYYEGVGGITVSGGEAFAQPAFLKDLLRACKEERFHTLIETCGYFNWELCEDIFPYIDMLYFDIKQCGDEHYKLFTGVTMQRILENLKKILDLGKKVVVRIPVIMECNGNIDVMHEIARKLVSIGYHGEIHLLPYHAYGAIKYEQLGREYTCDFGKRPEKEDLELFVNCFKNMGFEAKHY